MSKENVEFFTDGIVGKRDVIEEFAYRGLQDSIESAWISEEEAAKLYYDWFNKKFQEREVYEQGTLPFDIS